MTPRLVLLGHPVAHSLSPVMQNAALAATGLEWRYEAVDLAPEEVAGWFSRLRPGEVMGGNVTIPHKERVFGLLRRLTPVARSIGAVNTFFWEDGELAGDNTDAPGLVRALTEEAAFEPAGASVLLFGTGGAGRAAAFGLAAAGVARIVLSNRTRSRADALARALSEQYPGVEVTVLPWEERHRGMEADGPILLINATSLGMAPRVEGSPLPEETKLPPGLTACDLVYHPLRTRFLEQVARAGGRTVDGLAVLLHQGALAFTRWTDRPAPVSIMKEALARGAALRNGG